MASSTVKAIYSLQTRTVATPILITEASLIAHIRTLRNAGWVVKPPPEAEIEVPPKQFGFKLLTQNPHKRYKVMHLQYNFYAEMIESILKQNPIRIREYIPSFQEQRNIPSDIVKSGTVGSKGQTQQPTKVKHN